MRSTWFIGLVVVLAGCGERALTMQEECMALADEGAEIYGRVQRCAGAGDCVAPISGCFGGCATPLSKEWSQEAEFVSSTYEAKCVRPQAACIKCGLPINKQVACEQGQCAFR
jgi:hypothetical protein